MSWLEGTLTSMTMCWRIERRDGVTIGLTAHDRDLEIDGLIYRASPGMTPSAISRSAGLDADSMDVTGALTSATISEGDLFDGRWDGAAVTLFATDWRDTAERVQLGGGTIGAVETRDGMLTAELLGRAAALERPVVEETTPECRAELGDRRCRVAMAARRRFARVVSASGAELVLDGGEAVPGAYGNGRLRWFGGANCGVEASVVRSTGAAVTLRRPPSHAAEAGTLIEIVEGCDKSLATCFGRFGNAVNFRAEPYLPGVDLLTRYPGA